MVYALFLVCLLTITATPARAVPLLKILFFGDSITTCTRVSHDFQSALLGYRRWLLPQLVAAAQTGWVPPFRTVGRRAGCNTRVDAAMNATAALGGIDYIHHDAVFGRTVVEGAAAVGDEVARLSPDIVVFHLGVNDIIRGKSAAHVMSHLHAALLAINNSSSGVRVIVPTLVDLDTSVRRRSRTYRGAQSRVREYNEMLLREPFSPLVTAVDFTGSNRNSTGPVYVPRQHSYDSIHPNAEGERVLAERLFGPVSAVMKGTWNAFTAISGLIATTEAAVEANPRASASSLTTDSSDSNVTSASPSFDGISPSVLFAFVVIFLCLLRLRSRR